jgi:hypothetical protein
MAGSSGGSLRALGESGPSYWAAGERLVAAGPSVDGPYVWQLDASTGAATRGIEHAAVVDPKANFDAASTSVGSAGGLLITSHGRAVTALR